MKPVTNSRVDTEEAVKMYFAMCGPVGSLIPRPVPTSPA